jgi:hypothetical protein
VHDRLVRVPHYLEYASWGCHDIRKVWGAPDLIQLYSFRLKKARCIQAAVDQDIVAARLGTIDVVAAPPGGEGREDDGSSIIHVCPNDPLHVLVACVVQPAERPRRSDAVGAGVAEVLSGRAGVSNADSRG